MSKPKDKKIQKQEEIKKFSENLAHEIPIRFEVSKPSLTEIPKDKKE